MFYTMSPRQYPERRIPVHYREDPASWSDIVRLADEQTAGDRSAMLRALVADALARWREKEQT